MKCLLRRAAPQPGSELAETEVAPDRSDSSPSSEAPTAGVDFEATAVAGGGPIPTGRPKFEFSAGQILAERYRVVKMLGRGGMGEVWRAYDLKLRLDVALKTLHLSFGSGDEALEILRGEVRAAREVISPNVCRLFDIVEVDEQELVSMEYIDGETLLDVLKERGPLPMEEARELASQFLAGLEAIHQADLVHRDIKPENIMLTRAGRVVIMDFGLTAPSGEGMLAGTPAYMAPEQGRGEATDARADVFSAGMVLAEMLSAERRPKESSRQSFWENVRKDPPQLPDTPWTRVLLPAVALDPGERYASAAELARILEEVTIRVEGAEDQTPYPGLASFSEDAAEFFFGREAEVEALWKKLQQAYLLGLVGASGSGKSSFVNAGLLPSRPDGWAFLQVKPGRAPFAALREALHEALGRESAPALDDEVEAEDIFVTLREWRAQHPQVLLIVDQFEELFTQNDRATQGRFAGLMGRAALDGDVHVLLSMRDDFLMRCHDFDSLDPLFSELTPLKPPMGSALRRALTQPALRLGYRFESDSMVEEMLGEVTKERGALPLIAFTAARLWEERDAEEGLLTRAAYDEMGGVGGALAQHAEATLDGVGRNRAGIVRELFRNLITAQGTRAVMEVDEVLSVFDEDRQAASEVLQALIDARLLTSYEVRSDDSGTPQRRVEVVHESLLSAWPRLVRWRTQDAEGAQLRDELRQAAKLWDTRGRSEDLLWAGTAFREFALWRERYPGRLTALEEDFAAAMVERAERARRRRRNIVGTVMAALLVVVVGVTALWRQSEVARARAEAQKLVALGQLELESFSTVTLAHAIKSLEIADSQEGRLLAMRALRQGPPIFKVDDQNLTYGMTSKFSPDGRYILHSIRRAQPGEPLIHLVRSDGSWTLLEGTDSGRSAAVYWQTDDLFLSLISFGEQGARWTLYSASQERRLGEVVLPPRTSSAAWDVERSRLVAWRPDGEVLVTGMQPDEEIRSLGKLPHNWQGLGSDGRWLATFADGEIGLIEILDDGLAETRVLGSHPEARELLFASEVGLLVSRDASGEIRFWDTEGGVPYPPFQGPPGGGGSYAGLDPTGRLLHMQIATETRDMDQWTLSIPDRRLKHLGTMALQDNPSLAAERDQLVMAKRVESAQWQRLWAPDGALPIPLQNGTKEETHGPSVHPAGTWFASAVAGLTLWNLTGDYLMRVEGGANRLVFDPEGRELFGIARENPAKITAWELRESGVAATRRTIFESGGSATAISPDGRYLLIDTGRSRPEGGPTLISLEDGSETVLPEGFHHQILGLSFSPDGRYAAASGGQFVAEENVVKIWDLETLELLAVQDPEDGLDQDVAAFAFDNDVLWIGPEGLFKWNLSSGESTLLVAGDLGDTEVSADGRTALIAERTGTIAGGTFSVLDLQTGERTELTSHGVSRWMALDPSGDLVATLTREGILRIGRTDNSEPHIIETGTEFTRGMAIDPLHRWIALGSTDDLTLWPIPDFEKPPSHIRPLDGLLAELRSLTNARLVEEPESTTGWKLEWGSFPGWDRPAAD